MPRQCRFCDQRANSLEHIWPEWVLDTVKSRQPMRQVIGKSAPKILKAEVRIKAVCKTCNEGWMSQLEGTSIPVLRPLIQDIPISLEKEKQNTIVLWATKTAMLVDAVRPQSMFYTQDECLDFRHKSLIPRRTIIWLGRFFESALCLDGTDIRVDLSKEVTGIANGCVTTILVGHVVIQVVTVRALPEYNNTIIGIDPRPGPWDSALIRILPKSPTFMWPPQNSFTNRGTCPFAQVLLRWRMGKQT